MYDRLVKGGQLLIEEPIRQHPDMNKLCPDSVNTVRIVTLVTAQGAQMVYALVRMGMGGVCVDNVSSGGMYAPVNEHGQLYRPAFCDKTGKYYERHPVTGTEITGFQIPLFDQALELCRTASRRVEAHLKYIGWDVAITPRAGGGQQPARLRYVPERRPCGRGYAAPVREAAGPPHYVMKPYAAPRGAKQR